MQGTSMLHRAIQLSTLCETGYSLCDETPHSPSPCRTFYIGLFDCRDWVRVHESELGVCLLHRSCPPDRRARRVVTQASESLRWRTLGTQHLGTPPYDWRTRADSCKLAGEWREARVLQSVDYSGLFEI